MTNTFHIHLLIVDMVLDEIHVFTCNFDVHVGIQEQILRLKIDNNFNLYICSFLYQDVIFIIKYISLQENHCSTVYLVLAGKHLELYYQHLRLFWACNTWTLGAANGALTTSWTTASSENLSHAEMAEWRAMSVFHLLSRIYYSACKCIVVT